MDFSTIGLAVLVLAMVGFLVRQSRRDSASIRALRAAIFDPCLACFDTYRITQDAADFPFLDGRIQGRRLLLEPVVDAVTVRKLPVLWLRLTLPEPLPINATLSLLVRPQGTEFWSPSASLAHRLDIPPGWPEHALLRSDNEDVRHLLPILGPFVQDLFPDLRAKELVVSPRGVRLVYQLDQARRSNYLVLRTALFDEASLAPDVLMALVERSFAIHAAIGAHTVPATEKTNVR